MAGFDRANGLVEAVFAVQYAKNEKRYLYRFLESGDIPIDNNCANGMKVEEYLAELFRSQPGTLVMPW